MRFTASEFNILFNFDQDVEVDDLDPEALKRVEYLFSLIERDFDMHRRSVYGRREQFPKFNRDHCQVKFDPHRRLYMVLHPRQVAYEQD